jgi:hypothetical protein
MGERRTIPWKSPGFLAVVAVAVAINLIVDWLWFKPASVLLFLIVEAVVLGAISLIVKWANYRTPSG